MDLGNGLGHLTYSTLVHPGDDWDADVGQPHHLRAEGEGARLPATARSACRCGCRAVGRRRWSTASAEREKLKKFLADNDMYLYTVNAFPYGPFKGTIVKEQVYEPDWRSRGAHAATP